MKTKQKDPRRNQKIWKDIQRRLGIKLFGSINLRRDELLEIEKGIKETIEDARRDR